MRSKLLIIICVLTLVVFVGCANKTEETNQEKQVKQASAPINTSIASGPIAGAFYPVAGGISAIVKENEKDINITVQVTAGVLENARLVGTGQVDLGMVSAERVYNAVKNLPPFKDENLKMEALGTLHPTVVQIVTLKSKNIKTFQDLVGKRVALGEPGGGSETQFQSIVKLTGYSMDDFKTSFMTYDQSMDHLADGLIDASVIVAGMPAPAIIQLATKQDVAMVSIPEDLAKKIMDNSPTRIVEPFPSGSIPGVEEEFFAITDRIQFVCKTGLDEELAYRITKALYSNLDKLVPYHASAKFIFYKQASSTVIPLNKGAEKFYKEVGLIK